MSPKGFLRPRPACRKIVSEVGRSPLEVNTIVSGVNVPLAVSCAPPVFDELLQQLHNRANE